MYCTNCSQSFTSEKRLQQHERAKTCHTDCPHCKKTFSALQKLRGHIKSGICRRPKEEENPDNRCKRCQRAFSSKQRLQSHMESNKCQRPMTRQEKRPAAEYKFGDLECFDCGDLMMRCECLHIERLNKAKKRIDEAFGEKSAYFDDIEGVPWEDRVHWSSMHHNGCKAVRDSEDHIWGCLYPLKDRSEYAREVAFEDEELIVLDNACYGCKRRFSSKQSRNYHMSHNVCGQVSKEYFAATTIDKYAALEKRCEDEFEEANKAHIEELGTWMKNYYGGC